MTRLTRAASLAALALALAAGASACGSKDAGSASDTTTPSAVAPTTGDTSAADPGTGITKADYLTQANAICDDATAKSKPISATIDPSDEAGAEAIITDQLGPIYQDEINAISALGAPAGDEDTIGSILLALQTDHDTVLSDPSQLLDGTYDSSALDAQLNAYGLTSCASSGSATDAPTDGAS